jgi:hypothetical protein
MHRNQYRVRAKVWLYPGMAGWHFVSLPKKPSAEIKTRFGLMKRGWGSLPVAVTILRPRSRQVGKTSFRTSIFPDKKSRCVPFTAKSRNAQKGEDTQG